MPMITYEKNQSGISSSTIILFGLLVLTVVLVDAMSIIYHRDNKREAVTTSIISYCGKAYPVFPVQCPITRIYLCGQDYLLNNDCSGTGTVIINSDGRQTGWCDYTSLDSKPTKCLSLKPDINNCFLLSNLCAK